MSDPREEDSLAAERVAAAAAVPRQAGVYSQSKAAFHTAQLTALRTGQPTTPVHVQLILSDLCNQDCSFCAYRMSAGLTTELFVGDSELAKIGTNNPQRQIPYEKAVEIVDDCAALGVKAIQFTGGGEPTAHPQHRQLFVLAQALGMETALVTNGVRLLPTDPGILGMTWIRVSMDAGTRITYAAVRRTPASHWDQVWDNVAALAKSYRGTLGMGFVVTAQNYREIAMCARLARDAGVHNLRISAVFSADGTAYYGDLIDVVPRYVDEALAEATSGFEVYDNFRTRSDDLDAGHYPRAKCWYQHLTMYIGGDQNVYRCCTTSYTTAGLLGSLKEQRLTDLMATNPYEPFDARGCSVCQFRGQNAVLHELVQRKAPVPDTAVPRHVNFV